MPLRPLLDESFEECRDRQFGYIHTTQKLIETIKEVMLSGDTQRDLKTLAREVIKHQRQEIKETYAELKEMQRWWNKKGRVEHEQRQRLLGETS